jgi:AraC-like DNA-binding protein
MIKIACNKLRDTNFLISEIAYSMGFRSPTTFSNVFRKEMGCTCKEYKEQFHKRS